MQKTTLTVFGHRMKSGFASYAACSRAAEDRISVMVATEMSKKKAKAGITYRTNDIVPGPVSEIIETLRNSHDKLQVLERA